MSTPITIATAAIKELRLLGEVAQDADDLETLQDAILDAHNRIQRLCADQTNNEPAEA